MIKMRFQYLFSLRQAMTFAMAAALVVALLECPASCTPPRGYFSNPTYVGPVSDEVPEAHYFIPAVSADHLTLYFCDSNRLGSLHLPGNQGLEDIWFATRESTDEQFTNVQSVGTAINTSNSEVLGNVSIDGLTLYFSQSGSGSIDMYQATRESLDDQFSNVVSLGPGVNTSNEEAMPFVTNNGLTLVYEVAPAGQLLSSSAEVDIWMATRASIAEPFGNAHPLAMNSTSADDWYPSLSSDGLTLFTSDWVWQGMRPGSPGSHSTWVSSRASLDDPFSTPVLITDLWPDSVFETSVITNSFISQDWPAQGSKLYWMERKYPDSTYGDPRYTALVIYQANWIPYLEGDFNLDGSVNGADLLLWQKGESPKPLSQEDLTAWQTQYGPSASEFKLPSLSVPEPSTFCLLLAAGLFEMFGLCVRRPASSERRSKQ